MNKLFKLIVFLAAGLANGKAVIAQNINFQFRDTSGLVNSFIDIPLRATTSLTGRNVLAYSLQFSFSSTVLSPQGVVTSGTLSADFGTPIINTSVPGLITIAGAGSTPLSGLGNFIFLRFKILAPGATNIINTGINNNYFNEGNPVMSFQNNCNVTGIAPPVISVTPATAIILRSETQQFSASGGASPYTFSSLNPAVATITPGGLLSAQQIGFTNVKAVDFNGFSGQSNTVEIRGYKLTIPDTTGLFNSYLNIPVRVTTLTGLNILAGTFNITYNSSLLTNIQIETASSLLQDVGNTITNLNTPGIIQFSFTGTSAVNNAGVLFWIRCKLSNASGGSSALNIQNAILNEDLVPITKNGSVNYSAPPVISISPNSGQLVYGDSLHLSVTGANALAPFVWSVSDTSLASISASGNLKVKKSGQITATVLDANSATSTSGIFQLYDTYLKVTDTGAVAGAQVEIPIKITSLPLGQEIFSLQGRIITSNPSVFSLTDIVTTGTPSSSFSLSTVQGPNYIQFAIAGISSIPGNSILFKVRGTLNQAAQIGNASTLSFQNLLLNEGQPFPFIQNGSVTTFAPPVIYTFIGSGNWNIASNWANNLIPPASLTGLDQIIIDPAGNGECILNTTQQLFNFTKFTVKAGKKLRILSYLNISK